MNSNSYFLGIDGGGTKTTAVVFNEKGEFILMQYSEHYGGYPDPEGWGRVNVMHRKLRIKPE